MISNVSLCVIVLQDAAIASSRQSFIDEYFGGEFETTYPSMTRHTWGLILCLLVCCIHVYILHLNEEHVLRKVFTINRYSNTVHRKW